MAQRFDAFKRRSEPVMQKVGTTIRKGIDFERKAFSFGTKAIGKGWEYGFSKPAEMREKMQEEMEKQREEMGY